MKLVSYAVRPASKAETKKSAQLADGKTLLGLVQALDTSAFLLNSPGILLVFYKAPFGSPNGCRIVGIPSFRCTISLNLISIRISRDIGLLASIGA